MDQGGLLAKFSFYDKKFIMGRIGVSAGKDLNLVRRMFRVRTTTNTALHVVGIEKVILPDQSAMLQLQLEDQKYRRIE